MTVSGALNSHTRLAPYAVLDPRHDVRQILSRRGQTVRGRIARPDGLAAAQIESTLEARFSLRAQASAEIAWFETQPLRFRTEIEGLEGVYTPDVAAGRSSGRTCLVEVKWFSDLSSPDVLRRLVGIRRYLARQDLDFLWATDRELNREDENLRICTVKNYSAAFTLRQREAFDRKLIDRTTLTIGEAAAVLGGRAAALHLVAHKVFWLDYRRPLEPDLVMSRNPQEANHVVTLFSDW